jgi:hypothetical protein
MTTRDARGTDAGVGARRESRAPPEYMVDRRPLATAIAEAFPSMTPDRSMPSMPAA